MLILKAMQQGVTLIELMIGIAIVSVLMALGVPEFRTFIQNSQIRNAADALQNGINLAKGEAVRRNTNVQFKLGTGSGWTVECAVAIADADADGVPECAGSSPVATTPAYIQTRSRDEDNKKASVTAKEVNAATGLMVAVPVFTDTLNFNGRGATTTLPLGSNAVFDITHSNGEACAKDGGDMRCMRVIVTFFGDVRMCDPARAAGDPQAC